MQLNHVNLAYSPWILELRCARWGTTIDGLFLNGPISNVPKLSVECPLQRAFSKLWSGTCKHLRTHETGETKELGRANLRDLNCVFFSLVRRAALDIVFASMESICIKY